MTRTRCSTTSFGILALGLAGVALTSACGSDGEKTDGGLAADTGTPRPDAGFAFDAGPPADTGPRPDAGQRDAGYYCATNNEVAVSGTRVAVNPATMPPTGPENAAATVSCIDDTPPVGIRAPVRLRACLEFIGGTGAPTAAELAELQIAVFSAKDIDGNTVNPSFDRTTGLDRATVGRIRPDIVIDSHVAQTVCRSGVRAEIGRGTVGDDGVKTDVAYTIRVRGSTAAAARTWIPTYFFNAIARADNLEPGSSSAQFCTPDTCSVRLDVYAIRQSAVAEMQTAGGGAALMGAQDLNDGLGSGHAIIQAYDCQNVPMTNAVAGYSPAPVIKGYVNADRHLDPAAMRTAGLGFYVGLGFTGTSSATPGQVTAAVGVARGAACTEEFGGGKIAIFPDSFSVFRSGRETPLHGR